MERLKLYPYIELCLIITIVVGAVFIFAKPISAWTSSLWVVDYPNEFIKRGLLGEFLQISSKSYFFSKAGINIFCQSTLLVLSVLLSSYFYQAFDKQKLLLLAVLVSGFSIQQFIFDVGRFDQVNFILTLLVLYFISVMKDRSVLIVVAASVFSAVMLLIHEAAIFINIPLILGALFLTLEPTNKNKLLLSIYALVCILIMLCIALFGMLNMISYSSWLALMHARPIDFAIDLNAMEFLNNTLSNNVQITLDRLLDKKTFSRFLRLLLLSVPTFFVIHNLFASLRGSLGLRAHLLWLPMVSILPLFILGIDFYRWLAILQLNFFILLAFSLYSTAGLKDHIQVNKVAVIFMIVVGLYTGPFGISVAMPERLMFLTIGG